MFQGQINNAIHKVFAAIETSFRDWIENLNKKMLNDDNFLWNVGNLHLNYTATKAPSVDDTWIQVWLDGDFVAGPNSTDVMPRVPVGDWMGRAESYQMNQFWIHESMVNSLYYYES